MEHIRSAVADCIEAVAANIRQRIKRYPETAFDPSLAGEKSALTFEILAQRIRLEAK